MNDNADRRAELDALLDAFDPDTLGDDPAEFDEWLALYEERQALNSHRSGDPS